MYYFHSNGILCYISLFFLYSAVTLRKNGVQLCKLISTVAINYLIMYLLTVYLYVICMYVFVSVYLFVHLCLCVYVQLSTRSTTRVPDQSAERQSRYIDSS